MLESPIKSGIFDAQRRGNTADSDLRLTAGLAVPNAVSVSRLPTSTSAPTTAGVIPIDLSADWFRLSRGRNNIVHRSERFEANQFYTCRSKLHLLRHCIAVFIAEMAVGTGNQYTPVLMPLPLRNGLEIHAVLDRLGDKT